MHRRRKLSVFGGGGTPPVLCIGVFCIYSVFMLLYIHTKDNSLSGYLLNFLRAPPL